MCSRECDESTETTRVAPDVFDSATGGGLLVAVAVAVDVAIGEPSTHDMILEILFACSDPIVARQGSAVSVTVTRAPAQLEVEGVGLD